MVVSGKHQDELRLTLERLKLKGFRTIDMNGRVPDGLAVKEGKVYAVEILPDNISGRVDSGLKRIAYSMFDGTIFSFYRTESHKRRTKRRYHIHQVPWYPD